MRMSSPLSPAIMSEPKPPTRMSRPLPPVRISLPAPPTKTSLPAALEQIVAVFAEEHVVAATGLDEVVAVSAVDFGGDGDATATVTVVTVSGLDEDAMDRAEGEDLINLGPDDDVIVTRGVEADVDVLPAPSPAMVRMPPLSVAETVATEVTLMVWVLSAATVAVADGQGDDVGGGVGGGEGSNCRRPLVP